MIVRNGKGQGTVEYLMLIAILVLGFIVGLNFFKDTVSNAFSRLADVTGTFALISADGSPPAKPEVPDVVTLPHPMVFPMHKPR